MTMIGVLMRKVSDNNEGLKEESDNDNDRGVENSHGDNEVGVDEESDSDNDRGVDEESHRLAGCPQSSSSFCLWSESGHLLKTFSSHEGNTCLTI